VTGLGPELQLKWRGDPTKLFVPRHPNWHHHVASPLCIPLCHPSAASQDHLRAEASASLRNAVQHGAYHVFKAVQREEIVMR
jgi:hypothetical protein